MSLEIVGWEQWQTYRKDRGQPPWIKVHRRLLRNPKWIELTDAQRGQLVVLWLLAADHDGKIESLAMARRIGFMSSPIDIQVFVNAGFITVTPVGRQDDAKPTPQGRQDGKQLFLEFVRLTQDEYQKLIQKFGQEDADERIQRLNDGIGSKGYKYQSHYHTILTWDRRDKKRDKPVVSTDISSHGVSEEEAIRALFECGEISETQMNQRLKALGSRYGS